MIVYDACRVIRERVPDAAQGQRELDMQCGVSIQQWNPSKPATLGTSESVLIRGVATIQG